MPMDTTREQEIFQSALSVPREDLAAMLERECRSDATLLRRVGLLIAAHERIARGDETPGILSAWDRTLADRQTRVDIDDRERLIGTILDGRYRLDALIGEGGMGTVFQATQIDPVVRSVAVKLLRSSLDRPADAARFDIERQALARMDHPHIARILDGGHANGRPFFVMDLIEGLPLTRYCDGHQFTIRQRLELFLQVCHAVAYAHQRGIIHRDLKAANVLVATVDGRAVPKVIDFGIAKTLDTPGRQATAAGLFLGTPEAMSPEQANQDTTLDTRTDVYSLGALLYALLTGHPPVNVPKTAGVFEVLRAVREQEPVRPSERVEAVHPAHCQCKPATLTRQLRGDLNDITLKALEKDRNRRYDSVSSLLADLQRHLVDEPIEAKPPGPLYRIRKFARRNRGLVAGTLIAMAAMILGIAATVAALFEAREQRRQALAARDDETRQRTIAVAERDEADAIRRFLLIDVLRQVDVTARAEMSGPTANPTMKAVLDRSFASLQPDRIDAKFPNQKPLQAAILTTLGESYLGLSEYTRAAELLERAVGLHDTTRGADHGDTLQARYLLGLAFLYRGQLDQAKSQFEIVHAARVRILGADHLDTLSVCNALGTAIMKSAAVAEGVAILEATRDRLLATVGPRYATTLAVQNNLATGYQRLQRYDDAAKIWTTCLETLRAAQGDDHPQTLKTMANLAVAWHLLGRYEEAVKLAGESLERRRRTLGPDHIDTIASEENLGRMAMQKQDWIKGIEHYRNAHTDFRRTLGEDATPTIDAAHNLAWCLQHAGQYSAAIPFYERVRVVESRLFGPGHERTLTTTANLAFTLASDGQDVRAAGLFLEAATGSEKLNFKNPHAATILDGITEHLRKQKRFDEAERWCRKHLEWVKPRSGETSEEYQAILSQLSELRK
ncbi:hypothetical protein BH11PLA2_BH11PLA2_45400 [soil metagenome]